MSGRCCPVIFDAYVFLIRGLAYRARDLLRTASNDRNLSADELASVQDALYVLEHQGVSKTILHIGSSLSGHEKMSAADAAKKITL